MEDEGPDDTPDAVKETLCLALTLLCHALRFAVEVGDPFHRHQVSHNLPVITVHAVHFTGLQGSAGQEADRQGIINGSLASLPKDGASSIAGKPECNEPWPGPA